MQPQDSTSTWLFKAWPWLEANAKKLAIAAAVVLVVIFLVSFYTWHLGEKEKEAGQALTQVFLSPDNGQKADAFLKITADYPGTMAGQRALLQAAATLFAEGKFTDAQTQFQNYINNYPENALSAQASLGIAACLNAEGKTNLAADAYLRTVNEAAEPGTMIAAKFGLAQIDDAQGKISDAINYYRDVIDLNPNGSFAQAAGLRIAELQANAPATPAPTPAPAPATNTTFNLSR
ncbi:MAG TPA: tetratricopeptide repeat protein [Verrucomicrobiae bacterium]|nr:tetratricopeptide repeat protein [Verrucomicrobiae bacterium]